MRISLRYACLICHKKSRRKHGPNPSTDEIKTNPKLQEIKLKTALQQASEYGSLGKPQNMDVSDTIDMEDNGTVQRSRSLARLEAQKEFLKATSLAADTTFETEDSIDDLDQAFGKFLTMYPKYKSSEKIDQLRVDEYAHLADNDSKICLDYCGFGLFSFFQVVHYCESCSFSLSEINTNLSNYALYGGMEQGTAEHDIKSRIMDYLNIPENEYGIVLTASRGSAFKLLAESYPFNANKTLLTMFDHESQSVNWMAQRAKQKGAKVHTAWFKWPTLKPCSTHLRKQILHKKRRKKDSSKGLFVFPVQSRVTGAKYSYQWMSFAQQNNWHVLLDAGALGPLDMDSLGLSLFRPDFIITSFYRVFGFDPTGFGCLLIKKSVIKILRTQPGHTSSGIVKINPLFLSNLSDSMGQFPQFFVSRNVEATGKDEVTPETDTRNQLPAFSGVLTPSLMKDVYETDMEYGGSPDHEETGIFSVMKSPILNEDQSPADSMWIDLGNSPLGSQSVNFKLPLPPPFWFTRKKNNTEFDSKPHESYNATKTQEHSPEIQEESVIESSAIRRETEGDYRLLGRRAALNFDVEDDNISDEESDRREPEITCRHLDHVNMLGLSKTTIRLRFLINWLVTSLLQLRLPGSNSEDVVPLVHIYGPKIKYERGASVAFNIRDRITGLISPDIVQKMAEANGISVGIAILSHVKIIQSTKQSRAAMDAADTTVCRPMDNKNRDLEGFVTAEVVTASLGFLTNFEDVYKLWVFVAKFLNPSFVRQYGFG
ncbi:putative molybdenum cofactor sulfurtransferase [Helianthus debilis subsp. tardiflorus]